VQRDKANLDIFWVKDESLEDAANLPEPDLIAAEIIEDLGAALMKNVPSLSITLPTAELQPDDKLQA